MEKEIKYFSGYCKVIKKFKFRDLLNNFQPNNIILGDCLYSSYFVLSSAILNGFHIVSEFRKSRRNLLKKRVDDQIITLKKPRQQPNYLTDKEFNNLSDEIKVRIVRIKIAPKWFRTTEKFLITTLTDS